ncbi:MAG: C40 family peptidase [Methylococcales bacterium]|nr:C40 family peptidase [Methylococcales bacterium]
MFFITACSSTPKADIDYKKLASGTPILKTAKSQLGVLYRYGGRSPATGFDCSGLTWFSHKTQGINIPRQTAEQFQHGKYISKKNLKRGDLVFFETYRPGASHVGIYSGNGMFIHSPNRNKRVQMQSLSNVYFKHRYLGARRYW